eukprot:1950246-Prorocentrum_lima.AAC.1
MAEHGKWCANKANQGSMSQSGSGQMVGIILLQVGDGWKTRLCIGTKSDYDCAHMRCGEGDPHRSTSQASM